mmetsp:Transcript_14330/g.37673  ORF Transcript_14330/g.37673 Transcript_14330/m.37673 type:complete len:314 (-) Transcript_14330:152-1093(-)
MDMTEGGGGGGGGGGGMARLVDGIDDIAITPTKPTPTPTTAAGAEGGDNGGAGGGGEGGGGEESESESAFARIRKLSEQATTKAAEGWSRVVDSAQPHIGSTRAHIEGYRERLNKDGIAKVAQEDAVTGWRSGVSAAASGSRSAAVWAGQTAAAVTVKAAEVTATTMEASKPYVEQVMANPNVERVVGNVRAASVGAGKLAETVTSTTQETVKQAQERVRLIQTGGAELNTIGEQEAWKEILKTPKGQEIIVNARVSYTQPFLVPKASTLRWTFRVAAMDVGFAVRLRIQGDGGASEVDVFAAQRYAAGVTGE